MYNKSFNQTYKKQNITKNKTKGDIMKFFMCYYCKDFVLNSQNICKTCQTAVCEACKSKTNNSCVCCGCNFINEKLKKSNI